MYILAIETTGPVGSVAVTDADNGCSGTTPVQEQESVSRSGSARGTAAGTIVSAAECVPMKITTQTMSHLKNLIPMAAELLEEEHIDKDEICAVAASVGPGSFTGIRIGVSTARALAQAWDVPCISVPTLELFREKCGRCSRNRMADKPGDIDDSGVHHMDTDGSVCVIFNARRGQVYGACYDEAGKTLIEPGPYMLADMLDRIGELRVKPVFYGDGVDAYFDKEGFRGRVNGYAAAPEEERYQTADMTARYAREVWDKAGGLKENTIGSASPDEDVSGKAGGHGKIVPYDKLLPDYMRESEAEQRLRDGSLEKMRKAKMEKFMKMAGKL